MRLIDVDATIPMIKYATTDNEIGVFPIKIGFDDIVKVLNAQPTVDAVSVIRCKDCKYWGADGYRYGCKYATRIMIENDYCSRAEREEE